MAAGNSAGRAIYYPEWQTQYEAALLEADGAKLPRRVEEAQSAISKRLQVISGLPTHYLEKEALENALGALRVLTREARR